MMWIVWILWGIFTFNALTIARKPRCDGLVPAWTPVDSFWAVTGSIVFTIILFKHYVIGA